MFNRYVAAVVAGIVLSVGYSVLSAYWTNQADYHNQALSLAASGFTFCTCAVLLFEIPTFSDEDLGRLKYERTALMIGLMFTCIYVPLTVFNAFHDIYKVGAP